MKPILPLRRLALQRLMLGVAGIALPTFTQAINAVDNEALSLLPAADVGSVMRHPLGSVTNTQGQRAPRPEVWFGDKRAVVAEVAGQWWLWLALPLSLTPGLHTFRVQFSAGKSQFFHFMARDKAYPEQRLIIKNTRQVTPLPDDIKRIEHERKTTQRIYQLWNEEEPHLAFQSPFPDLSIRLSSKFGLKRFFNDQPRNPHSGLDFAAAKDTPIHPIAEGVVVNTGDYFFNGRAVFVHHGQGVISFYCHMESIGVKVGTHVKPGSVLGTVGATGRATGAHLHLGVYFSGVAVDPEPLLFG